MKKYILLVCLCSSTLPLCAYKPNYFSQLYHKVVRYHAEQKQLAWVLQIQKQLNKALPNNMWGPKDDMIPARKQPRPQPEKQLLFDMRIQRWQQLIDRHRVLKGFTLKVFQPQDALSLRAIQLATLTGFLQNGLTVGTADPRYVPVQVEVFKHYLVRLTLQPGLDEKPLYLIANCHTHELFLTRQLNVPGFPLEPLTPQLKHSLH